MMFRSPPWAESASSPETFACLSEVADRGFGAVKSGDEYIVFKDDLHYTTRQPPPDVPVTIAPPPRSVEHLFAALNAAIQNVVEFEHPFVRHLPEIEAWYADPQIGQLGQKGYEFYCLTEASRTLLNNPPLAETLKNSVNLTEEGLYSLAWNCIHFFEQEYTNRRSAGDSAACGVATFFLFALTSNIFAMSKSLISEIAAEYKPSGLNEPLPWLSPQFYLLHEGLAASEAIVGGLRCAQLLQDHAVAVLRAAKGQLSCEMFLEGVFVAAVDFRAAQLLYEAVKARSSDPRRRLPRNLMGLVEEAAADAIVCEEYLAHSGSSLRHAIDTRESKQAYIGDLTDPLVFEMWLDNIGRFDQRKADARLMESCINLELPKFLADYGRCVYRTRHGQDLEYAKATLEKIIPRLELAIPIGGILNDPNFLQPAYRCMADACRQLNLPQEAERYTHLASEDVFEERLRQVEQNINDHGAKSVLSQLLLRKDEFRYE